MLILSIAIPVETAAPALQALASAARPLIGLGLFAALLVLFKPLIAGLLRSALLIVAPRQQSEERNARKRVQGILQLNRMARELDASQPGLAAELRTLASRG
jgi:hypothetical protein